MADAHDLDAHLQLRHDERKLEGSLRIGPKVPLSELTAHTVRVFLEARGVGDRYIDKDAVQALIETVRSTPGAEQEAVVARGRPPRDGERRILDWTPRIADRIAEINARKELLETDQAKPRQRAGGDEEEADAVDHYSHSAFIIVSAGEVLGTVTPPDPGEDGEDIFGGCVPARKSPMPAEIDQDSLELLPDHRLIARVAGRLIFSGGTRAVETTLTVSGDVGFATGHIDFPGPVHVEGGVKDRFRVVSRGNTTIRKLVEAAILQSARDIVLERGVAGRETASISAARNVESGYLESATITTMGDCNVKREITNCEVRARGNVNIPTGAIRGGTVAAAHTIEAATLGSAQEVVTEILAGSIPELDGLLARVNELILEAQNKRRLISERNAHLFNDEQGKNPQLIERRMGVEFELSELDGHIKSLQHAARRLEENIRANTAPRVVVAQKAFPGVAIYMRGHRITFKSETKGPFTLRINGQGRPVVDTGAVQPADASTIAEVKPSDRVPRLPVPDDQATAPDADSPGDRAKPAA